MEHYLLAEGTAPHPCSPRGSLCKMAAAWPDRDLFKFTSFPLPFYPVAPAVVSTNFPCHFNPYARRNRSCTWANAVGVINIWIRGQIGCPSTPASAKFSCTRLAPGAARTARFKRPSSRRMLRKTHLAGDSSSPGLTTYIAGRSANMMELAQGSLLASRFLA